MTNFPTTASRLRAAVGTNSATLLETDRVDSQRGLMQFGNVDVNAA